LAHSQSLLVERHVTGWTDSQWHLRNLSFHPITRIACVNSQCLARSIISIVLQIWAILFNLIPLPGLDGYGVIAPFLNPIIREQWNVCALCHLDPNLALWYLPFVGSFFWGSFKSFH